jgi:NAD(P)-dependent dehydrogenase (short-subunit alcohol dehydrogenase family)
VAVVTGGSAGIGLAASRALTERGWRVLICGRDASKLVEAERGLSAAGEGSVAVCETDVGVEGGARRAVEAATERFGRLDALVNNAGYAPLEPISNTPREVYERSWAVNVMGPAEAIAAAWSAFEEQHTADPDTPGGRVVNVTTLGVADPFPGFAAYAAGKAGAASLARSVKNEGDGIGVLGFAVAPGAVETGMLRDLFDERTVPPDICLTPDEVGAVIAACACGERDADNGKTLYLTRSEGGGVEERVAAL